MLRRVTQTSRAAKIKILRSLMAELYLSTSCAAGNHMACRFVSEETALVCCCPECAHDWVLPSKRLATGPLLHSAATPEEQLAGYIYRPAAGVEGVQGVRADLVRLVTEVVLAAREDPAGAVILRGALKCALFFAPRF